MIDCDENENDSGAVAYTSERCHLPAWFIFFEFTAVSISKTQDMQNRHGLAIHRCAQTILTYTDEHLYSMVQQCTYDSTLLRGSYLTYPVREYPTQCIIDKLLHLLYGVYSPSSPGGPVQPIIAV